MPKKNGKRKYYRRFKRYRQIYSYDAFKTKLEYFGTIQFKAIVAPAALEPSYFHVGANYYNQVFFNGVLRFSTGWNHLKEVFGYYKIIGAKVQITPTSYNLTEPVNYFGQVYVGIVWGDFPVISPSTTAALNSSIMVSPNQYSSTYSRAKGEEARWHVVKNDEEVGGDVKGGFVIASTTNGSYGTTPVWNVKFSLYILFKRSKI